MTQDYYWTQEWQEGEREADEDIKAGKVKCFSSTVELITYLRDGNNYEVEE